MNSTDTNLALIYQMKYMDCVLNLLFQLLLTNPVQAKHISERYIYFFGTWNVMRISSLSVAICCITFWHSTWVCSKNRQPQVKVFFSASTSFFIWNLIICTIGSSSRIFFHFVKCQIWILFMIKRITLCVIWSLQKPNCTFLIVLQTTCYIFCKSLKFWHVATHQKVFDRTLIVFTFIIVWNLMLPCNRQFSSAVYRLCDKKWWAT